MLISINNYFYDTSDIIDSGMFATVYRGINRIDKIDKIDKIDDELLSVAIKVIMKPSKIKFNESTILKLFDSENIVKLFDSIETIDSYILILELCDFNLEKLLKSTKLTIKQIQNILQQFVTIIELLKDKKIIHHDIKPANLLVKVNEEVMKIKLCDFEMAITNDQTHDRICGSPMYMHPIKLLYDKNFNSDPWSFTIIFYELIYNRHPFKGAKTKQQLYERIKQNIISYPFESKFTSILKKIFEKCGELYITDFFTDIMNITLHQPPLDYSTLD